MIQFQIYFPENIYDENYTLDITLKELQEMNRYFLLFISIEDCANNLHNIIKDSEPKLVKEKNKMVLIIYLHLPGQERKQLEFNINKNVIETNQLINNYINEIKSLKTKIDDLEFRFNLRINEFKKELVEKDIL